MSTTIQAEQCKNCIHFVPLNEVKTDGKGDGQLTTADPFADGRRDCATGSVVRGISGCVNKKGSTFSPRK